MIIHIYNIERHCKNNWLWNPLNCALVMWFHICFICRGPCLPNSSVVFLTGFMRLSVFESSTFPVQIFCWIFTLNGSKSKCKNLKGISWNERNFAFTYACMCPRSADRHSRSGIVHLFYHMECYLYRAHTERMLHWIHTYSEHILQNQCFSLLWWCIPFVLELYISLHCHITQLMPILNQGEMKQVQESNLSHSRKVYCCWYRYKIYC